MKQDDPRTEEILFKMQELLTESRLLKNRHDELAEQYLELKLEFEERSPEDELCSRFHLVNIS